MDRYADIALTDSVWPLGVTARPFEIRNATNSMNRTQVRRTESSWNDGGMINNRFQMPSQPVNRNFTF